MPGLADKFLHMQIQRHAQSLGESRLPVSSLGQVGSLQRVHRSHLQAAGWVCSSGFQRDGPAGQESNLRRPFHCCAEDRELPNNLAASALEKILFSF